jgi:dTDP-4-dehydrorhamnose reductase
VNLRTAEPGWTTAEYFAAKPDAALRPLNSVLDLGKLERTGFRPRDWRTALEDYLGDCSTGSET